MNRTLFVAWKSQSPAHAWYPIARLDANPGQHEYLFRYTHGAIEASKKENFQPLVAFPDFLSEYRSSELFPLFKNRVLDKNRKDFDEYLGWLALDNRNADPIEILSITGGERRTDNLEVFPKIEKTPESSFSCRFFLHGIRYLPESGHSRVDVLTSGERLQVAVELNNPATGNAIQLQSTDKHIVGYAPRYLIADLSHAMKGHPYVDAKVIRVNHDEAPLARRVLVEICGKLPPDYEPMSSERFVPIADSQSRR